MKNADSASIELPRELESGFYWLGGCLKVVRKSNGSSYTVHLHHSAYLVRGSHASVLVDTGHPKEWDQLAIHLEAIVGSAGPTYLFPTHPEMNHAGNLGRLLRMYPDATVVGDIRDYQLYYPEHMNRLSAFGPGSELDLGGTRLVFIEAVIRDLPNTLWAYDTRRRILFVADGLGFFHEHGAAQCALTTQELGEVTAEQTAEVNERALYWTKFVDLRNVFDELDATLRRLKPRTIAPAHGSVITDPDRTVRIIKQGMLGSQLAGPVPFDQQPVG